MQNRNYAPAEHIAQQLLCVTRAARALARAGVEIAGIEIGSGADPVLHVESTGALARGPGRLDALFPGGWHSIGMWHNGTHTLRRYTGTLYGCAVEWARRDHV